MLLKEFDVEKYERTLKKQSYEEGQKDGMQQGMQQGIQKGIQKGIQQGMQQGIQQGMQQGIQKGIQQGVQQGEIECVRKMLRNGMSAEQIAKVLEISVEQVKVLTD